MTCSGRPLRDLAGIVEAAGSKSLLLLFFRKEVLPSYLPRRTV
jgi:hypothetical protein